MRIRFGDHPAWRQLLIISVALPIIVGCAVLAFAWPAAHIGPREVPVGVVATGAVSQQVIAGVERARPGAVDATLYADVAAARRAIENREVYGALVISPERVTVLTASAASATVADTLTAIGHEIAHNLGTASPSGTAVPETTTAVVPASSDDPRGLVISAALLPLTICSIIIAAVISLLLRFRPAWRQVIALTGVSATAGLGAFLVAESWLGALPDRPWETWAALSLTILAMSATTAGFVALVGSAGLGLGAALMVFIGNPFSGTTSAPELLPVGVDHIGQWLPPGAGANLVRSTAYFHGNGAAVHLAVLLVWSAFGLLAVFVGHHSFVGYAARRHRAEKALRPHASQQTIRVEATLSKHSPVRPAHGRGAHEALN